MKIKLHFVVFFIFNIIASQNSKNLIALNSLTENALQSYNTVIGTNGFKFQLMDAGVNTKYSEIGSGFFKNKFIMVSSKKLGAIAKIDPNTNEAYKELFCLDINNENGVLSSPLLFSRILNTNDSEDQLAFSPDESTVYYTRSNKENSIEYKLYKATLEEKSHGNWINHELLDVNKDNVSIENPFVNSTGDKLYFSANLPDSYGGHDLYVSNINADGTLSTPKNLGNTINTSLDDKYPSLSMDDNYLYFASRGHTTIGGFDIFMSKISNNGYKTPRNLGNTINTKDDEIAYFLANKNRGYVSSNREGVGGFDIYTVTIEDINQTLTGTILDAKTQTKLSNTLIVLKDEDNIEIDRQLSGEDGTYSFNVKPYESYYISTIKDGFQDNKFDFFANKDTETTYNKDLELDTTKPLIAKVETAIVLENIYFDFDKWNIKKESLISLNNIISALKKYPKKKLTINAHTDNIGHNSYNIDLSNKRAASVFNYFINNNISKDRLKSIGFGETKPLIDCKNKCTDADLQTNRRIEFVIFEEQ